MKDSRLYVRLDQDLKDALYKLAQNEKRSMSSIITELLLSALVIRKPRAA